MLPAGDDFSQLEHIVETFQVFEAALNVFGHVHQGCHEDIDILVVGGDFGILDVDIADEEIHVRQRIAELGRLAEILKRSPFPGVDRAGDDRGRVVLLDELGDLGFEIDIGLRAGAEVDSGNVGVQQQLLAGIPGAQHDLVGNVFERGHHHLGRESYPPGAGFSLFRGDLAPGLLQQVGRVFVVADNSRIIQQRQRGLVQEFDLVLV